MNINYYWLNYLLNYCFSLAFNHACSVSHLNQIKANNNFLTLMHSQHLIIYSIYCCCLFVEDKGSRTQLYQHNLRNVCSCTTMHSLPKKHSGRFKLEANTPLFFKIIIDKTIRERKLVSSCSC